MYVRLVENIVKQNKEGKRTTTKRVVKTLGKLDDLEDGNPNYLERLRTSFRDGRPLLPVLEPYIDSAGPRTVEVQFVEGTEDCRPQRFLFVGALLSAYFRELGIPYVLNQAKRRHRLQYDVTGLAKLLVFGRLLDPRSKIATISLNEMFFEPPARCGQFRPKDVYKALDVLYDQHEAILRMVHRRINAARKRNLKVVYYDVTNTFFAIDNPDEDGLDEHGSCLSEGLRRRGKSKEGRSDPIVQIALFMDGDGIPLCFEVFPGNVPDVSTLRAALGKTLQITELEKFLFVADRGICARQNCLMLVQNHAGYIISKSIRRSSKADQSWILSKDDWVKESDDFRYKSRVVTTEVTDADGARHELREKVVVYWSRKYYEKECAEHASMLEFYESMKDDKDGIPLEKLERPYVRKAFRKEVVVTSQDGQASGEVIPKSKLREMIDTEKLERDVALFGYYQIVTSELDMPDTETIRTYKQLVRIETEFEDMKSVLDLRPVYVRTPEHIKAHVLLCFLALTIMRLIQLHLVASDPQYQDNKLLWTWGISGKRLRLAMNSWQIIEMPSNRYAFTREAARVPESQANTDLGALLRAYDIDIPLKLFTKGELRGIAKDITIFR